MPSCGRLESSAHVYYQDIKDNIEKLIEEAIEIRNRYPK